MSELAAPYYTALAEANQFEVSELPPILNGEPIRLLGEGMRLLVRSPDQQLAQGVLTGYIHTLTRLVPLLIACTYPNGADLEEDKGVQNRAAAMFRRHTSSVLPTLLTPEGQGTGYRTDVQIQAVTPEEVSINAIRDCIGGMRNSQKAVVDDLLSKSVVLVTSANMLPHSLSHRGYVAFVGLARLSSGPAIACGAHPFSTTELKNQHDRWRPAA